MGIMSSLSGIVVTEQIVTNGLVVNLDAGNPSSYSGTGTTWNDLSGNANNGTLIGGPTYNSNNKGSIVFDGVNDYVSLGSTLAGTASGTIAFWIKLTNTITSGYTGNQRPWGKNGDFEARWGGGVSEDNRRLAIDLGTSTGLGSLISNQNTWSNEIWYNVATTWDSSLNRSSMYIQGVLDATGVAVNPSSLLGNFLVGATSSTAGPVNGQIPNWMYYNRELASSEVSQNFNALRGRYSV